MAATQPARPAEGGHAAGEVAARSPAGGRLVPLSDIIVTTSGKLVDLDDPEVRRMLTDLVTFEIDQAAQYRSRVRTSTPCCSSRRPRRSRKALGMNETASASGAMMNEIRKGD